MKKISTQKNKLYLIIGIILIILGISIFIYDKYIYKNNFKYNNLKLEYIYSDEGDFNLSNNEKTKIIKYLKQMSFKSYEDVKKTKCISVAYYKLSFDNYEINVGDTNKGYCNYTSTLYDIKNNKRIRTIKLSKKLVKYISEIANKRKFEE